jgi:signal peptidase I
MQVLRESAAMKTELMYARTPTVRRSVVSWLLLGMAAAPLMAGCGTSSADVASGVGALRSSGTTLRMGQSQVYRVPSGSMEPTLPIGARVRVEDGPPTVGAIVVFHPPEGAGQQDCGPKPHTVRLGGAACGTPVPEELKIEFIKRVVAGPGDEIYIRGGHVYRRVAGKTQFVREQDSFIRACGTNPECNFPVPIKIPPGHWFMMGDNRGESDDSRFYGPVPTAWIVGVAAGVVARSRFTSMKSQAKRQSFRSLAVANVVACLHKAGVDIPGSDPALLSSTSGIKTRSPWVKVAIGRCRSESLATASR